MEGENCCNLMLFWTKFNEVRDDSLKVRIIMQNYNNNSSFKIIISFDRKNGLNYFYSLSINFLNPQTMIIYTNIGKSLQHIN